MLIDVVLIVIYVVCMLLAAAQHNWSSTCGWFCAVVLMARVLMYRHELGE